MGHTNLSLSLSQEREHSRRCLPCFAFGIMVQAGAQEYRHSPAGTASGKLPQLQAECTCQTGNSPSLEAGYIVHTLKSSSDLYPLEHGIKQPAKGIFLCYLLGDEWFLESQEHYLQTYFIEEVQCNTFRQMFE